MTQKDIDGLLMRLDNIDNTLLDLVRAQKPIFITLTYVSGGELLVNIGDIKTISKEREGTCVQLNSELWGIFAETPEQILKLIREA
ncbi:MAG: hypothetical protein NUV49_03545 [Patescibacteria group bacterium]|nr:hypothetical protein [Patescibacteria group bacterium]